LKQKNPGAQKHCCTPGFYLVFAEAFVVFNRGLHPLRLDGGDRHRVDGTVAGRA